MRAKFQEWASIAEIVASIAVVVSVIYLAQEIRTATTVTSIERSNELYTSMEALTDIGITNKELRVTIGLADNDYAALTEDQKSIHFYFYLRWFNLWERSWAYHRSGLMDDESWAGWENGWIEGTPCHAWKAWFQLESGMNSGLVAYIHDEIFPKLSCPIIESATNKE